MKKKIFEEKYIEGTPQISEVTIHRDESAEFIDGIGKEDVTMKEGTAIFDIYFWVTSPKDGDKNYEGLLKMLEVLLSD